MIDIENLHKSFGDVHVLKGIDLNIKEKEVVAIIGPSGSGKSTLALAAMGYLKLGLKAYKSRRADPDSWILGGYATKEVIEKLDLLDVIRADFGRLDVLFNNAGGVPSRRALTAEGLESSFAGNHLGEHRAHARASLALEHDEAPGGEFAMVRRACSDGDHLLELLGRGARRDHVARLAGTARGQQRKRRGGVVEHGGRHSRETPMFTVAALSLLLIPLTTMRAQRCGTVQGA